MASAVGLALITVAATTWLAVTTVGFVRRKSFARGSAVVCRVFQGTVSLASNQGVLARPDICSELFVPVLLALALMLFSTAVSKHRGTTRDAD